MSGPVYLLPVVVRGVVNFACRATTPTPGKHLVQVHVVIEQPAPRSPHVHAYLPMGTGSAGMDRAEAELRRLKRGTRVEAAGSALTVVEGQPDQLWLRGCERMLELDLEESVLGLDA